MSLTPQDTPQPSKESNMQRLGLPPTVGSLTPARLRRLENYLHAYRDLFPRSDQWQRFACYLRGLLDGSGAKNMKGIAVRLADAGHGDQTAQALQHFVTSSPWDSSALLARYRALLAGQGSCSSVGVVHDVIIPKKGRHSVGAQRQHARDIGRKINCQVAVAVSQVGADGFLPLALRLYLPGGWLRDHRRTAERIIPVEDCRHLSREEIAATLLATLFAEGWRWETIIVRESYLRSDLLHAIVARSGCHLLPAAEAPPADHPIAEADRGFDWLKGCLGLDQFEGRSWRGWHHHASLVLAAWGFLQCEWRVVRGEWREGRPAFTRHSPRATHHAEPRAIAEAVSLPGS
jgi:SRSO17 transposase